MTPIERAAEALYMREQRLTYSTDGTTFEFIPWARIVKKDRDEFYQAARAVIKAIREPSEAMTKAGRDSLDHDSDGGLLGGPEEAADNTYSRMIDALLEEGR